MKRLILALSVMLAAAGLSAQPTAWQPPPGLTQIPIWPGAAPDAQPASGSEISTTTDKHDLVAGKPYVWVENVTQPTMTVYPPKGKNTGVAVIVFPGGGFMGLAMDLEGTEVCDWLTSKGVSCVLLKYRVPRSEDYYDQKLQRHVEPKPPTAFQDAQRAISLTRSRAAQWGIDPRKIGVMGFSAGGYLAAKTSTEFERRAYKPVDAADQESCRPDFSVPIYPGHLWRSDDGSTELKLNPKIHVTSRTPPIFLLQAEDDYVDNVNQALVFYIALKEAKVPVEMHLYAHGGHAFGLRSTRFPITAWPQLVERWLRTIGMIPE
ncbi:MAG: alpha/beta hydrolase [Candidatus Riflebacteria bacterium]|nr:alpha/beta hydrolase [Candidatus Riflebacteria bacterium]